MGLLITPSGGGGAVSSVFGRTGAVVAVAGDYSSISLAGGSVTINVDGSITDTPASGKNWTLASGSLVLPNGSNTVPSLNFVGQAGAGLYYDVASNTIIFNFSTGFKYATLGTYGFRVPSAYSYSWVSGFDPFSGTADLLLYRDAAGILAQRNGSNAQIQRWYETTDGTNSGWIEIDAAASGPYLFRTKKSGTGTLRGLQIQDVTTSPLGFFGTTPVTRPATTAGHGATAGVAYTSNEQSMLQDVFNALEGLGLMA
jgi:hypothetical protein